MHTAQKVVGVACACLVALGLAVLYVGATKSEPFPLKTFTTSESSHRDYSAGNESLNLDTHLLQQWFEGLERSKHDGDTSNNEGGDQGKQKDDGCNDTCGHNVDTTTKNRGVQWNHQGGNCNPCGHNVD